MQIFAEPLTAEAFAPYGQVLQARGEPDRLINQGLCGRFHDLAKLDFGAEGRAGISIFHASLRTLPYRLEMLERHPEGSQTFLPLDREGFLVTVALDAGGIPAAPKAFMTRPGQGINLNRGTWHGVLTPLA